MLIYFHRYLYHLNVQVYWTLQNGYINTTFLLQWHEWSPPVVLHIPSSSYSYSNCYKAEDISVAPGFPSRQPMLDILLFGFLVWTFYFPIPSHLFSSFFSFYHYLLQFLLLPFKTSIWLMQRGFLTTTSGFFYFVSARGCRQGHLHPTACTSIKTIMKTSTISSTKSPEHIPLWQTSWKKLRRFVGIHVQPGP